MIKAFVKEHKNSIITASIILIVLAAVLLIWRLFPVEYSLFKNKGTTYEKGRVVSVNSQTLEDSKDTPGRNIGIQNITVEFTEGEYKGESVTFDNYLSSVHSIEVVKGTRVVVKCDRPDGVAPYYSLYQYDRSSGIITILIIFAALLIIVGCKKGLMSGLALFVSIMIIGFGLLPLIYNGFSPILASLIVCVMITVVTLLLLNGFSKKTLIALLSTFTGLFVSVGVYALTAKILNVTGYNIEETESLIMVSRETGLKISEVIFSGILLASLGAVMDTTMSISSALYEITCVDERVSKKSLFKSGMNMGSDMIGTMCQTLVLAFVGSSIALLLVVYSYGTQLSQFLASEYFAVELFQSLTGSFAVILAVPITSWMFSMLYKKKG